MGMLEDDLTESNRRFNHKPMTFRRFSAANLERCESPDGFKHKLDSWSTSDWFLAMLGELGEAANIAKKLNRVRDGIPGNKETPEQLRAKLRHELGDAFVYLDLIAQSLGFYIGDAAVEVFNSKSREIGFPKVL
jgi:NTP pyrophosphatase (non-canonical NTP hydrolase)